MHTPQLTIITPVGPAYRLAWLQELAQSILAATSYPVQWIIVSDGEPIREMHQVIRKIVKNTQVDVEFIWLRTSRGPSFARNLALRKVKAPLVMSVDHDDVLLPDSIDLLLEALDQQKTEWVAGVVVETDEFGEPLEYEPHNPFSSRKRLMKNAFFLYRKNHGYYPFHTHGGAIISTAYLRQFGWDTSMETWGDHLAFFTELSKRHEAAWIDTPVLFHRQHEHSLNSRHAYAMKEMDQMIYNRLAKLAR